jgi:hypothetical protein
VAVPWLVSMGCGGNHATLTRVVPATACATGGVTVGSGADSNDNGVLDDDEVKGTNDVCNGAQTSGMAGKTGFNTVVATTDLASGDPNCQNGGTQIDLGLDDGAGGGTAGDGILQPGEVMSTKYVCNGTSPTFNKPITPPEAPGARYKIDSSGGNGAIYSGGSGGDIYGYMDYGTNGGHVKVFATGSLDASFTIPTLSFHAGDTPGTIAADTVLNVYANPAAGITAGDEYFMVTADETLYKNVAAVATPVTSLDVASGVTLTLADNYGSQSQLRFSDDIRNAGKIVTAFSGSSTTDHCTLYLYGESNFFSTSTSEINTAGESDDDPGSGAYLYLYIYGTVVNQGRINTDGGDGANYGASGGGMYIRARDGALYNTGKVTSHGGFALLSNGGSGGNLQMTGGYRGYYNSGNLDNSGGDGLYNGGSGGGMTLEVNDFGPVTLSGEMRSVGGQCSDPDCSGGNGGDIYSYTYNSETKVSGNVLTYGADGKGSGDGGDGGGIYFYNYDSDYNWASNTYTPTGSMRFWASLISKGGNGGTGGSGGEISIEHDVEYVPQGQELIFYGLQSVTSAGGSGVTDSGGSGGVIEFYIESEGQIADSSYYAPGGAIVNYVPLDSHGGDGRSGGGGGEIYLATQTDNYFGNSFEMVINRATIDGHGGSADGTYESGGDGAEVSFYGVSGIDNDAPILGNGGMATGTGGTGGYGGSVYFGVDNSACSNTGATDVSGGPGFAPLAEGGGGGYYGQRCAPANNGADVNAAGGDGDLGGNGGQIELMTSGAMSSTNTGAFSIIAGSGFANGIKGTVFVDGVNVTP